jgi:adenylate cyclase
MKIFGKYSVSLRITLFTAFIGTIIFTTLLNACISSLHVRNLVKESIREKIYVAVGIGAKQIDGELHSKIGQVGDESGPEFQEILEKLDKIRKINPDIKNVYTIRQDGNKGAYFVVDADPKQKERARIGHKVILITPAIKEAFASKDRIVVENDYFQDEWGTFISGFAPFYRDSGELEGLLGMDVMAETVQTHQLNNILAILFTSFIVTIVSVFLSLIVSREISNPISAVTQDMRRIQQFELGADSSASSIIHEIKEMTDALESMKKGLRSFKKYVPTELVSDLIKLKKEAALEVENRNISILFTDIRDFTSISEKITPEALAESIGIYFGEMTKVVMETGGIVDKYIGDAVMALWGTPHSLPDHPLAA